MKQGHLYTDIEDAFRTDRHSGAYQLAVIAYSTTHENVGDVLGAGAPEMKIRAGFQVLYRL